MKIHVKESTIIRPAQETPKHGLRNSDLDLMAPEVHMPNMFFYRRQNNSSNFFEAGLLKEALSKVLVPYYPMAGRFGIDENGRLEIDCNGEGVLFIEAETSCAIDDLGDYFALSMELLQLVPTVDYSKGISSYPLAIIQATHFKCGGICLGVMFHHTVADAISIFNFVKTWAEIARGAPIGIWPFFDRTALGVAVPNSPSFPHVEYDLPPNFLNTPTQNILLHPDPGSSSIAVLKLSRDQINTLKEKSNKDHGSNTNYTKFEILAAHIWRCACRARELSDSTASKLYVVTNGRSRFNPPLPSGYVGNIVFNATSIATSGEIRSEPLNYTAQRICTALKRMDDEYLKSTLSYLNQQPDLKVLKHDAVIYRRPNLFISNLANIPMYDSDFGWGKPMFVKPLPLLPEGVMFIFPTPENDGSLSLIISLESHSYLRLFKKLFYEIFLQPANSRSRY